MRLQTARFLWSLIAFRPWLFWINCLSIVLLYTTGLLPGFVAQNFFDTLAANGSPDLLWLFALLLMSSIDHSAGGMVPRPRHREPQPVPLV